MRAEKINLHKFSPLVYANLIDFLFITRCSRKCEAKNLLTIMPSDSKKKEMQRKKDARNKKVTGTSTKKDEVNGTSNGSSNGTADRELTVSKTHDDADFHSYIFHCISLLGRRTAVSEVG